MNIIYDGVVFWPSICFESDFASMYHYNMLVVCCLRYSNYVFDTSNCIVTALRNISNYSIAYVANSIC